MYDNIIAITVKTHLKNLTLVLVLVPAIGYTQGEKQAQKEIFSDFEEFIYNNVYFGLVDYEKLNGTRKDLNKIVTKIEYADLEGFTEKERKAFYINSYNILVIKQVVENYPIKSPMDVDGFFKSKKNLLANEMLTLDEVESEKLNTKEDPRIHFALGCAARSCPLFPDEAYIPEKLENQLEFRSWYVLSSSNYIYVKPEEKTVLFNKIFDWYSDEFLQNSESLIQYANQYRERKIPVSYSIDFQEYDWSLNDL